MYKDSNILKTLSKSLNPVVLTFWDLLFFTRTFFSLWTASLTVLLFRIPGAPEIFFKTNINANETTSLIQILNLFFCSESSLFKYQNFWLKKCLKKKIF